MGSAGSLHSCYSEKNIFLLFHRVDTDFLLRRYIDSLNKKEIIFYSWITDHSVDKNENWVRIWYKEIDSYKNGRIDSIELQDDNLMKDGKIEKVYSHMRKLGP